MIDLHSFLNTNLDTFNALLAAVVAVATVRYVAVTARPVRETERFRAAAKEPAPEVSFRFSLRRAMEWKSVAPSAE